jgi:hypothetical protein
MPPASKPLDFSYDDLNALTDKWSDLEIAFRHGLSYAAVRKARVHYGIKTFTQKTGMVRIGETGEIRPKGSVRGAVRTDGLRDDFFRVIDEPEKAYWLGALLADGWVTLRGDRPKEVGLAVTPDDAEWLVAFQRCIGHSGRIVIKENRNSLAKGGVSAIATVRVTCQRFTQHAIEAGIVPRKSGITRVPELSDDLTSHFARGLFDGDGGIGKVNFALICNGATFCTEMQSLIRRHTGVTLRISSPCSPVTGKPVYRLTGYRKDACVLRWMYQGQQPVLARKYEKFSRFWS